MNHDNYYMKHRFVPILIAMVISLTSLSECMSLFPATPSVVSAEINGQLYSSLFEESPLTIYLPEYDGKHFKLTRYLRSKMGEYADIVLYIPSQNDSIPFNQKYYNLQVFFGSYPKESIKNSWIELTDCYRDSRNNPYISGLFEFDVIDSETGEIVYEVRNGMFDVPYV